MQHDNGSRSLRPLGIRLDERAIDDRLDAGPNRRVID
jgi:hypothetical protein